MKWAHLPMAGGIYDQHPALMDRFYYILSERSKEQEKEQAKRDKESGPNPRIRNASRANISRSHR